ncbi:hypothetical protein SALBM311S_10281 [Streptomyces alboniger]
MNGAQRLPFGESAGQALTRATEFLRTARDADGWWNDYEVRGPGQFWATAFVGASLAELPDGPGRSAAESAWELLRQARGPSDGWGYCPQVPGDADITSWVLRLAEALGAEDDPRAAEGYRFVAAHLQEDGGISSYLPQIAAPFLDRVAPRWDAWYASHACVTSAAAGLLRLPVRERLLTRLREIQRPDGSWPAYWWPDREYPTALAVEALTADRPAGERPEVRAAARWAAARIGADGAVRTVLFDAARRFAEAFGTIITIADDLTDYDRNGEREGNLAHLMRTGAVPARDVEALLQRLRVQAGAVREQPASSGLVPVVGLYTDDVLDRLLPRHLVR